MSPNAYYSLDDILIKPPECGLIQAWNTRCPRCGVTHAKPWEQESDLCKQCKESEKQKCTTETADQQTTVTR